MLNLLACQVNSLAVHVLLHLSVALVPCQATSTQHPDIQIVLRLLTCLLMLTMCKGALVNSAACMHTLAFLLSYIACLYWSLAVMKACMAVTWSNLNHALLVAAGHGPVKRVLHVCCCSCGAYLGMQIPGTAAKAAQSL